ncbi:MAG: S41 family peptidase [Patescibacteria group bacterium]|nr:MAG: S41 family peptidase [Patescibacteria group bacterium]
MLSPLKRLTLLIIAVFVVGSSFSAGFYARELGIWGAVETLPQGAEETRFAEIDFSAFWEVWDLVNEKHVSSNGPTDQEKVWGAVSGLVGSLDDPYTVFFPPREAEYFESEVRGNFEGVGMEIGIRDKVLTVVAPLKGTPAERAGVRAGDKVIKIDDTSTFSLTIDESVDLIRGERGTPVVLTIVREGEDEPFEVEIIRDVINIPTISTEKRDDGVFVIQLYNFSASSPSLFRSALREFVESKYDKLVLDLRNNPGGYLEASIDMASWFLPAGKVVVRETSRGANDEKLYRSKGYNIFSDDLKFAILINRGSASASEILAGALSEYGKATLIGEKTFGKGSVQELIPVTEGSSLKITIARWLTPSGISISGNGLTPDIEVEITKEDIEEGKDPQLERAIEVLLGVL